MSNENPRIAFDVSLPGVGGTTDFDISEKYSDKVSELTLKVEGLGEATISITRQTAPEVLDWLKSVSEEVSFVVFTEEETKIK